MDLCYRFWCHYGNATPGKKFGFVRVPWYNNQPWYVPSDDGRTLTVKMMVPRELQLATMLEF